MNKYKIVCIVLALSLFVSLTRLVYVSSTDSTMIETAPEKSKVEVVLENIYSRKSVRNFLDQPVSREQLDTLVRAAMAAPTGWDLRPWRFVVLDDRDVLTNLASTLGNLKTLAKAPAAIIVCADDDVTNPKGKKSLWNYDCSLASENLLLAAEAMGLGAVWLEATPNAERVATIQKQLGLPDHIIPLNIIPVGYPKGNPLPKQKYDASNIHFNHW